jgi:type IV secretory pathway VirB10-like protein
MVVEKDKKVSTPEDIGNSTIKNGNPLDPKSVQDEPPMPVNPKNNKENIERNHEDKQTQQKESSNLQRNNKVSTPSREDSGNGKSKENVNTEVENQPKNNEQLNTEPEAPVNNNESTQKPVQDNESTNGRAEHGNLSKKILTKIVSFLISLSKNKGTNIDSKLTNS